MSIVREVELRDLPTLAAIEQQRWSREDTPILSLSDLTAWYETKSPFFLVAEENGAITGFYYGMQIHFSMDLIREFTAPEAMTEQGYTAHVHDPAASSVYGVSVATVAPKAGAALNAAVHKRLRSMNAPYFIGFTRLVHLDHYLRGVEMQYGGTLPYPEQQIALWYAHKSMEMIHARTWSEAAPRPNYNDMPAPRRADTVLAYHVQGTRFGLIDVIPNYMEDPKSRNYGAFIVSDWPHIRE